MRWCHATMLSCASSPALNNLLSSSNLVWTVGAGLLQPIFEGGQLRGELALSKARQQELVAIYRSAALSAFSDVETALGRMSSLADQARKRTDQTAAAAEAFRIAEIQYRRGVTDLLSVLNAEQTLFSAQDELAQVRLARLQADVGDYQALGGGWSETALVAR